MCFDFRRARSHPLGPTINAAYRVGRNVHAKIRLCQGADLNKRRNKSYLGKELRAHPFAITELRLTTHIRRGFTTSRYYIHARGMRTDKKHILILPIKRQRPDSLAG